MDVDTKYQGEICYTRGFCDRKKSGGYETLSFSLYALHDRLQERISEYHATVSEDGSSKVKLKAKVRRRAVPNALLHRYISGIRRERTIAFMQVLSV
jgi:hypothetical protein